MATNPNIQKAIKVATIAGAAALVVKAATQLLSVKSPKEAIMPTVSILVGISAFTYAMKSQTLIVSEKK